MYGKMFLVSLMIIVSVISFLFAVVVSSGSIWETDSRERAVFRGRKSAVRLLGVRI